MRVGEAFMALNVNLHDVEKCWLWEYFDCV